MTSATRRAMTRVGALAGIALVIALLVGSLGGGAALATARLDHGAAEVVAQADPLGRAAVIAATLPSSAAADPRVAADQDERTRTAVAATFAPMSVDVSRQVSGVARLGDGRPVRLLDVEDLASHARLDSGAWASGPGEAALQRDAAAALGLSAGDAVSLADGQRLLITGLWHATDADDTIWALQPSALSGHEDGAAGPFAVDAQAVVQADRAAVVRWLVTVPRITESRVAGYRQGVAALSGVGERIDPERQTSVRVDGALGDTLRRLDSSVAASRSVLAVPAGVLALLGAIVLAVMVSGLWASRRAESELLRSRGQSLVGAALAAAAETAVAVAAGAVVAVVGVLLVGGPGVAVSTAVIGGAVVAGAALVAAVCAVREGASIRMRDDSRARRLAWVAPAVLVIGAAAFAVWQLLARASFLAVDGSLDPLASIAPALALLAVAMIVPLLAGPAAGLAAAAARRGRGILPVLPLRQLARRSAALTAAVLCVALAAAAVAFGTVVATGLDAARHRAIGVALGADVRVEATSAAVVTPEDAGLDVGDFAVEGVRRADPALRQPLVLGGDTTVFVAGPSDRILAGAGPSLRGGRGEELVTGENDVRLRTSPPAPGEQWEVDPYGAPVPLRPLAATAWIQDERGAARAVPMGELPLDGAEHGFQVTAAAGDRLLSVDLVRPGRLGPQDVALAVGAFTTTASFPPDASGLRLSTAEDVPDAVPVVITAGEAARIDARVGAKLTGRLDRRGIDLPMRVAAVVDVLPGSAGADDPTVAADFATTVRVAVASGTSVPAPASAWLTLADAGSAGKTVDALRAAADHPVRVLTAASATDGGMTAATRSIVVGALALAAALAAAGFVVVWRTAIGARAAEETPLRALGMSRSAQRRGRAVEAALAVGFALVVSAGLGLAVAALLAPLIVGVVA